MIAAVGHASHYARKVLFAGFGIDASCAVQYIVNIAKTHALRGDIRTLTALGKIMGQLRWRLTRAPKAAIVLRIKGRR